MCEVLRQTEGTWIASSDLAAARNALEGRDYETDLKSNQLGKRLAPLDIHPDASRRRPGGRSGRAQRGYTFRNAAGQWTAAWQDALTRYDIVDYTPMASRQRCTPQ